MKDIHHTMTALSSLAPAVYAASTDGGYVDLSGHLSAELVVNTGAIAGAGLYGITIEESDTTTDGDFAEVDAEDLLGEALPDELAADTVYSIGYIGSKRYIRAVITKASGTSIAASAVFVLGHPHLSSTD